MTKIWRIYAEPGTKILMHILKFIGYALTIVFSPLIILGLFLISCVQAIWRMSDD